MLQLKNLLLIALLIFLSSCGDLVSKDGKDKTSYDPFSICEMDAESITKILTKDIKDDLICLENNLYIFVDVVKTDRPGYLQQKSLITYVKENLKDTTDQTIEMLGAVFELNSLIFGGEVEYISKENIKELSELVISLNQIVVKSDIYNYFSTEEKISLKKHNKRKSKIYSTFLKIGSLINSKMIPNTNEIHLELFLDRFRDFDNKDVLKYSKALLLSLIHI